MYLPLLQLLLAWCARHAHTGACRVREGARRARLAAPVPRAAAHLAAHALVLVRAGRLRPGRAHVARERGEVGRVVGVRAVRTVGRREHALPNQTRVQPLHAHDGGALDVVVVQALLRRHQELTGLALAAGAQRGRNAVLVAAENLRAGDEQLLARRQHLGLHLQRHPRRDGRQVRVAAAQPLELALLPAPLVVQHLRRVYGALSDNAPSPSTGMAAGTPAGVGAGAGGGPEVES
jgi:hypothetical protein